MQNRIFPEPYLGWIPSVLRTALRLHREQRFDLVLATGNPFVSFAAARALGRLLRVPYVVDYRDAWTMNQFTEELSVPEGGTAMRWEGKVLRDAAEIVFVNDGMRRWHAERYPYAAERMQVVPNGWEPEIMGRPEFVVPDPDVPLRFAYLGTVTSYLPSTCCSTGGGGPASTRCWPVRSSTSTVTSGSSRQRAAVAAADRAGARRGCALPGRLRQGHGGERVRADGRPGAVRSRRAVRHFGKGFRVHGIGQAGGVRA